MLELLDRPEVQGALVALLAWFVRASMKWRRMFGATMRYARILAAAIEQVDESVSKATVEPGATPATDKLVIGADVTAEVKRTIAADMLHHADDDVEAVSAEVLPSVADKQATTATKEEETGEAKRLPRLRKWLRRAVRGQNRTGLIAKRAGKTAIKTFLRP